MNMRDLIPWGRQGSMLPARLRDDESNPFLSLRREMDRLFDDFFRMPATGLKRSFSSWPIIETSETDREIRITAEIPGMKEQDVECLVEDGILTIRGEKKS